MTNLLFILCAFSIMLQPAQAQITSPASPINTMAEDYVKLVLELGQYDPYLVDAYYGPETWKPQAGQKVNPPPYSELQKKAWVLTTKVQTMAASSKNDETTTRRLRFIGAQIQALLARIDILSGKKVSFDEEAERIYQAKIPHLADETFAKTLDTLDKLLPGKESLQERVSRFQSQFVIPSDRLMTVFSKAIEYCRNITKAHLVLPENENFQLQLVKNEPWGAYNWYKGNALSLIQVNTDIPLGIDRAIDLAAHEGYPGHHVFNLMIETVFYKKNGWPEYAVYPLFSPQSLLAEGTANYGIDMAFTPVERMKFETSVLFPLAGLDPNLASLYYQVQDLTAQLSQAGTQAARRFMDGQLNQEQAVAYMVKFMLMTPDRAQKRLDFVKRYGSYVVTYTLGQQWVRAYIEKKATTPAKKWHCFQELLTRPVTPKELLL